MTSTTPSTEPSQSRQPEYESVPSSNWLARLGQNLLEWAEEVIARTSRVGDKPFFNTADFPWAAESNQHWRGVRDELQQVLQRREELPNFQDVTPEVGNINTDNEWKTFFFYGYGIRCEENCRLCPQTDALLRTIPGMKTAFFSILSPGKEIAPHEGPFKGVLRYHLALIVPEPREQCRIRVADQVAHWREGECLIFDDRYDHQVWNETDGLRAVLFVDFERPCRFPGNLINKLILNIAGKLPQLRRARRNHDRWEELFYH
ncbi:MAG: aspartyl/asparaginyl beta-hydroxylase domain-containing protein [Wenzhouxiangellaceae bacterium]